MPKAAASRRAWDHPNCSRQHSSSSISLSSSSGEEAAAEGEEAFFSDFISSDDEAPFYDCTAGSSSSRQQAYSADFYADCHAEELDPTRLSSPLSHHHHTSHCADQLFDISIKWPQAYSGGSALDDHDASRLLANGTHPIRRPINTGGRVDCDKDGQQKLPDADLIYQTPPSSPSFKASRCKLAGVLNDQANNPRTSSLCRGCVLSQPSLYTATRYCIAPCRRTVPSFCQCSCSSFHHRYYCYCTGGSSNKSNFAAAPVDYHHTCTTDAASLLNRRKATPHNNSNANNTTITAAAATVGQCCSCCTLNTSDVPLLNKADQAGTHGTGLVGERNFPAPSCSTSGYTNINQSIIDEKPFADFGNQYPSSTHHRVHWQLSSTAALIDNTYREDENDLSDLEPCDHHSPVKNTYRYLRNTNQYHFNCEPEPDYYYYQNDDARMSKQQSQPAASNSTSRSQSINYPVTTLKVLAPPPAASTAHSLLTSDLVGNDEQQRLLPTFGDCSAATCATLNATYYYSTPTGGLGYLDTEAYSSGGGQESSKVLNSACPCLCHQNSMPVTNANIGLPGTMVGRRRVSLPVGGGGGPQALPPKTQVGDFLDIFS